MEILRTSAQKKFPACVDLRTKRPNTPQTSAGKYPQFSMRNITFFADISGTGRRESRGDEREGQGRKRNRNESEETEEIKTFPLYPYPLQG